MMFDSLQEKFEIIFKKLRGEAVLNEKNIEEAIRSVKIALLEADVNFKVVKEFIDELTSKLLGTEVLKSFTPSQQVIKIVHQFFVDFLGKNKEDILISTQPTVIMLIGLNGSGKTTTCVKLAQYFKNKNISSILVGCDIYRPAAIKQLQILGKSINVEVVAKEDLSPLEISLEAIDKAKKEKINVVILDTRGRLHIDDELMKELVLMKTKISPQEIILVADAMTGQDAVNIAKKFDEQIGLTGIILSKLDSDTRAGAALSMRKITGKPIKFVGISEKIDGLEPFYPDRIVNRILGMGDMLSLIEKAEKSFEIEDMQKLEKKIKKGETLELNDFLIQLKQVRKMGSLQEIISMLPGGAKLKNINIDEKELERFEAIIHSMTKEERQNPFIVGNSRKKRISLGSGVDVQDINKLLKRFYSAQKIMKQMGSLKFKIPFIK
ncbi:MAG: signal recognition particle protein [bacterium]